MKTFILSFFFLAITSIGKAQSPAPLPADEILNEAFAKAKLEKKKVFVMFHASWCVWCHKMDASINDASCKKLFDDQFVIRHLVVDEAKDKKNLENPGAIDLKEKYYGKDEGIPYWLIFVENGKFLFDSKSRKEGEGVEKGENVGCPATEKEVAYFIDVLKKTSSLTAAQLEIIRKRFRKNEL
jgi:thiol-disulfide isomerase/thioredoxin